MVQDLADGVVMRIFSPIETVAVEVLGNEKEALGSESFDRQLRSTVGPMARRAKAACKDMKASETSPTGYYNPTAL